MNAISVSRADSVTGSIDHANARATAVRPKVGGFPAARTCTYFGAHAETYLEEYPAVHLAPETTSRP